MNVPSRLFVASTHTQTNWRRSAKFKPVLAPLIGDAHANLTALGTSLTFAALEVEAASVPLSSAATAPTPASDQHPNSGNAPFPSPQLLHETELLLLRGDRAFFGHGAPRTYEAAFAAYARAAHMGSATAANSAAHMLRLGLGRHADADAAMAWCVRSTFQSVSLSLFVVALGSVIFLLVWNSETFSFLSRIH